MKIYFAASKSYRPILAKLNVPNILYSFHYFPKAEEVLSFRTPNIFIDSGGFTAQTQHKKIHIENYADYLDSLGGGYDIAANLDTGDFEETTAHWKYLMGRKIKASPVYHVAEYLSNRREWIADLVRDYKYICIGGMVSFRFSKPMLRRFLNYVFQHWSSDIRFHCFGMTHADILERYPFYSSDSTTYSTADRYGYILEKNKMGQFIGNLPRKALRGDRSKMSLAQLSSLNKDMKVEGVRGIIKNVALTQELERYITNLWELRGVKWQE